VTGQALTLRRIRLDEAGRSSVRVMEIREGERLTLTAALAYRDGWTLREVNDKGEVVAAYRKESRS
jgi:hypothetical protein